MKGEYYKMDFESWDEGTVDLSLEQEAAYLRLCHQMYRSGGPIPNSVRLLQGIFRCGHVKAAALLRHLITAGKIHVTDAGLLANNRVGKELLNRESLASKRRVAGELGGTNSGVSRAKSLAQKEASEANASGLRTIKEEKRIYPPLPPGKGGTDDPKSKDPPGFPEWWAAYPKRDGHNPRAAAMARYGAALKAGATPETLLRAVRNYAARLDRQGKLGTEYVKQAQYFLSPKDRLWEEYSVMTDQSPNRPETAVAARPEPRMSDSTWRQHVQIFRTEGGRWLLGNVSMPPDHPRTKVPGHILAECGIRAMQPHAA